MLESILCTVNRWLRGFALQNGWIRPGRTASDTNGDVRVIYEITPGNSSGLDEDRIDWAAIPGNQWYQPGSVAGAIAGIRSGNPLAPDILYQVANNHAGELYPASVVATTILLEIALHSGSHCAAYRALAVIDELVWFESYSPFDLIVYHGVEMKLESAIRLQVEMARPQLNSLAELVPEFREIVLEILESVDQQADR